MSSYTDCFNIGDVVYCNIENQKVIVGDNSTTQSNGAFNKKALTSLTIPERANGKRITEIGRCAFQNQGQLATVTIKAKITQINNDAFHYCVSLVFINIPSSVTYIAKLAISCVTSSDATASGILNVLFDYPSSIKTIGEFGFERKTNVVVYFGGAQAPSISQYLFYHSSSVVIYSPKSIKFGSYNTIAIDSKFFMRDQRINTCKYRNCLSSQIAYSLMICLTK